MKSTARPSASAPMRSPTPAPKRGKTSIRIGKVIKNFQKTLTDRCHRSIGSQVCLEQLARIILGTDGSSHMHFSEKGIREQEPLIRKYVDLLIGHLDQYSREGVQNMVSWYAWTTFDLIGDLTFGESFHCLENVYNHPWIAFVHGNIKAIPFISLFHRYGLFGLMQFFVPKKLLKARQQNYEYARDKVTRRVKLGKDRGDLLDKILKYEYPKGMTTEELISTGSSLVLAGSETTATLLAGATYILLKQPSSDGEACG
jgi:cytochrome P450